MTLSEARNELAAALAAGDGESSPVLPLRLVELEDAYLIAGIDCPKLPKTRALGVAMRALGLQQTWNGKFPVWQQTGHPRHGRRFYQRQLGIIEGLLEFAHDA